ncbi:MAG TPA: selenide, water dikinase SelD [Planctomycetota bacterium]|nr:selenide, water dikinase SelD [Planctomycetota bacterium]
MTPEQIEKRRRIMGRSMALGHCVCNPRKGCPCPLFRERSICECAGERPPAPAGPVRLTEHVRNAGCASKIARTDLRELLAGLPELADPRVVVGAGAGDDAGVIMLDPKTATILTVDVFAPAVDGPYDFGQIAAANSLSDIYAMGGTPQTALSILGFPVHALPVAAGREILRGGVDKMTEAGVSVIGGHSINDEEVKCGFAVLGTAPAGRFVTNSGARPGDALVLTKPLGSGIAAFAAQVGRAGPELLAEVTASMKALNRAPGELMAAHGASAATDVTGFSLLGHLAEIVRNSGVEVEIDFDAVPVFAGVQALARAEVLPGAVERNREAVPADTLDLERLAPAQRAVLFCPETSGGLLVCLPEKRSADFVRELRGRGVAAAAIIGRVTGVRRGGLIRATTQRDTAWSPSTSGSGKQPAASVLAGDQAPDRAAAKAAAEATSCCSPAGTARDTLLPPAAAGAAEAFAAYMGAVGAPGALGLREKKLIALALSVSTRCGPCIKINTAAARQAGAGDAEIAEAAALGMAFGGAPAAMFYNELRG